MIPSTEAVGNKYNHSVANHRPGLEIFNSLIGEFMYKKKVWNIPHLSIYDY